MHISQHEFYDLQRISSAKRLSRDGSWLGNRLWEKILPASIALLLELYWSQPLMMD